MSFKGPYKSMVDLITFLFKVGLTNESVKQFTYGEAENLAKKYVQTQ